MIETPTRRIHITKPPVLPPLGRFISQGMLVGAVIGFLLVLSTMVWFWTNGYNFVLIFVLPVWLVGGMAFGSFEGLVMWACTRLARRQLGAAVRAAIGVAVYGIAFGVYWFMTPPRPYGEPVTAPIFLLGIVVNVLIGAVLGLVTGSRLQPWREASRGSKELPAHSRPLTAITGVILRATAVWFLLESILAFTYSLQGDTHPHDLVFAIFALFHSVAALIILFSRLRFWVLLQCALLINFPTVVFLTDVLTPEEWGARCFVIAYLGIWALFLITRYRHTYSAIASVKEELNYYLFD